MNVGKRFRLAEVLPSERRGLILDLSRWGAIGVPEGEEGLEERLEGALGGWDAVVVNPGTLKRLSERLGHDDAPVALLRLDWSNAWRDASFPLPTLEVQHVPIAAPEDALFLGACGGVVTLLWGYGEEVESNDIRFIAETARRAYEVGMPLFVDIHPQGSRISQVNYAKAIELAASMMQEAGGDGLFLPYPGLTVFKEMVGFINVPMLIKQAEPAAAAEALALGASGLVLLPDQLNHATEFKRLVS